jgi:hypothetical protein
MPRHRHARPVTAAANDDLRAAFADAAFPPRPPGIPSSIGPLDEATLLKRSSGLSRRVHGVFASAKNNRSIPWSSRGQRDLMTLLEVDSAVLSFESAPEKVDFVLDGRTFSHVPAFRIMTRRGPAILDVRRRDEEGAGEATARFAPALAEIYAARGLPYRALSRAQIRVEPRFRNARWVTARCAHPAGTDDALRIVAALSDGERHTLGELAAALPEVADAVALVCAMAVRGSVSVDLSAAEPEAMTVKLRAGGPVR